MGALWPIGVHEKEKAFSALRLPGAAKVNELEEK